MAPKNMIWTFDNQTGKWRPSTVENTAVQTGFYSVETEAGVNDELEDLLGKIENDAAAGYEALLAGEIPQGQVKANFSMFLATLHLRTPAMINATAAGKAEMMNLELEMVLSSREMFESAARRYEQKTGKSLGDYEKLRSFVSDKSGYDLAVWQKLGLSIIGAADKIAPLLYAREWVVCRAMEGFFVTSDHPVFRWVPPETHHHLYGDGGFQNIKAEITFPLSPERLLMITGTDLIEPVVPLDGEAVTIANEMRALAAERYVYSHRRDDGIAALALEHKDSQHRWAISSSPERPNVKVRRRIGDDKA
jgi:hypothetical protein